jgi:hypothetical protein
MSGDIPKCRPLETLLTSAQSGLCQQCFLGMTFRYITLHGGHHFLNDKQQQQLPSFVYLTRVGKQCLWLAAFMWEAGEKLSSISISGKNCDVNINECKSNPCEHGQCIDEINSYRCVCDLPYTGKNCKIEMNPCSPNLCKNGAQCVALPNYESFMCSCPLGYTGKYFVNFLTSFLNPKWISHVPHHNVCRLVLMNAQNTSSYNKIV